MAVNVRKFVLRAATLHDLVELGGLSPAAAKFLEASVRAGLNILVAGGTQAGKTTLLNCLAAAIPGGERVVSCEEVFELPNSYLYLDAAWKPAPPIAPAAGQFGFADLLRYAGAARVGLLGCGTSPVGPCLPWAIYPYR